MKKEKDSPRIFSVSFKMEKVKLLEEGKISVRDLSESYEVSPTAVYKWIKQYSRTKRGERVVVEKISEEAKSREFLKRIADLERIVGKNQLEIDFYKTAIEALSDEYGEDLLKKLKPK